VVSPGLHHVQNNAGASQQASRAKKRRAQRIRAAAERADTVGRLPVRVHRSLPLSITSDGDYYIIDIVRGRTPDSPDSPEMVHAAGPDDTEERFRRMELQWHRQMAIGPSVAPCEFLPAARNNFPELHHP
jgi:hypothetical protein